MRRRQEADAAVSDHTGLSPDGFGGKECKGKVKGVPQRAAEAVTEVLSGDDAPPPAPVEAARARAVAAPTPKPSAGQSTRSSSEAASSKPLTLDQLISNSIAQKEDLLGRKLTEQEAAEMAAKVKKLMQ